MAKVELSAAQLGLLVGWCLTTTDIIRHADADLWVMAEQTPAFDYGTAIPLTRVYQVRSVPGVRWAEGMFMAWNIWQRPDGRRINVELVGLDTSCVGGPWRFAHGTAEVVHLPQAVIIDELFLPALGVKAVGDEIEMLGQRAVIRAISQEVRTFTASPFVFTSLASARRYDRRYSADEVTYVLARCDEHCSPEMVRDAIRRQVPSVECLTAGEFAQRTMAYWMLETGIGITVVITAILGFVVSAVIISQTLFAITQDHLANYAALLALGFGRWQLSTIVLVQSVVLGSTGITVGTAAYFYAARLSARTPIPLETTPAIFTAVVAAAVAVALLASFLSVRTIFRADPAQVFRA